MKKILQLVIISTFFIGCKEPLDDFQEKARKYANSDNLISLNELAELESYIEANINESGFEIFTTGEKPDRVKLIIYLEKEKYKVEKPYSPKTDAVTIYIENSLSMHGYINDSGSGFKNAVAQIFSVSEGFKSYSSNYINSNVIPVDLNTETIVDINVPAFTKGNVKSSNLDNIFKTVLSKTGKGNVSVLISDCIYSIEKGDATQLLKRQALLTQRSFSSKIQKENKLTTLILKLESDFTGTYFDKRDHAYPHAKLTRPYYIIIMGDDAAVSYFKSKIDFAALDGYKNSYTINAQNYSGSLYYSVVNTKNSNSTFRPIDDLSDGKSVKGIEDISVDEGDFTFTVAVDLSKLPVEETYKTDKQNYSIMGGSYEIKNIVPYSAGNIEARDANTIKDSGSNPTHLITFRATSHNYESLKFTLDRKTPKWITDTSIEDDTDITKIDGKTFGFSYLVSGIEKAYTAQNGTIPYFEILITLNK